MIDLHYFPTPNGHKITIFLEEAGVPYRLKTVNILTGEQFKPDFVRISPNSKMPVIVDHEPADGGAPLSVFESGAILLYLAEKTGRFLPRELRAETEVREWLFWQVAGLGPMAGQAGHFVEFAKEKVPYAIKRYVDETARLFGVLNRKLEGREYIAGDYSIADMASYPWIETYKRLQQDPNDFPHLLAWMERMAARPAVQRAYAREEEVLAAVKSAEPVA